LFYLISENMGNMGGDEEERTDMTRQHVQHVMDHTGDSQFTFNPTNAEALQEAEKRFKQLTGAGFTAAVREENGGSRVIRSFDPTAEETLFIPRLRGG
jgi:hypothetical protein